MESGKLRHVLRIEQVAESRDAMGGTAETWSEFATVRGSLEPIAGRELLAASQVHAEITARARLRYLPGVTTKMRITHESKTYDILSIIDSGTRNRWLELMLSEGLRDG